MTWMILQTHRPNIAFWRAWVYNRPLILCSFVEGTVYETHLCLFCHSININFARCQPKRCTVESKNSNGFKNKPLSCKRTEPTTTPNGSTLPWPNSPSKPKAPGKPKHTERILRQAFTLAMSTFTFIDGQPESVELFPLHCLQKDKWSPILLERR